MKKKKTMNLKEFANDNFMKDYFNEDINIIQDIQNFCNRTIGVALKNEVFEQLTNLDITLLKLVVMVERDIGYESF